MINTRSYFDTLSNSRGYRYVFGRDFQQHIDTINFDTNDLADINTQFFLYIDEFETNGSDQSALQREGVTVEFMLLRYSASFNLPEVIKYDRYVVPCKQEFKQLITQTVCRDFNLVNYSHQPVYDILNQAFTGIAGRLTIREV